MRLLLTRNCSKLLNQVISILLSLFKCFKYIDNEGILIPSCSPWAAKNAMVKLG